MVTAELAATLPAVIFVLVVAVNAMAIGIDQIRCTDAARIAARAAARGDSPAAVQRVGARSAPGGSEVTVSTSAQSVTVQVATPVPGPCAWLMSGRRLTAHFTTPVERSTPEP